MLSRGLVAANPDLQWSEGSYRGFFTLELTPQTVNATYFAMRNVSAYHIPDSPGDDQYAHCAICFVNTGTPNMDGFASASFLVHAGQNKLARPVAGGKVFAGALKIQT